ncbi:MAG: DNA-processing protein DprA [Halanaerobiales bacterium]
MREDLKEEYYWLGLSTISGLGSVRINKLLSHFSSVSRIWQANEGELKQVSGIGKLAKKIVEQREGFDIDKLLNQLSKDNINYITVLDEEYPEKLKNIYDPPPVLFYKGELNFAFPAVSIIGSRRCTTYGKKTAEKIAYQLANRGITVISGMARGIDTRGHIGALKAKGRTIAVLGSGLDIIYPPENKELFEQIQKNGTVLSEYPPGVEPLAGNFPQRNRIISGLSIGVLVIEAASRSGSLITANLALEQGRDVFAIPGNIDRPQSKGTNDLIKKGAKMVTGVEDIVEELYLYKNIGQLESKADGNKKQGIDILVNKKENNRIKSNYPELNDEEREVLEVFQKEVDLTLEQLIKLTDKSPARMNTILLKLELKGIISRSAGKKYSFMGLQSLLKPL